jgi:insulysin
MEVNKPHHKLNKLDHIVNKPPHELNKLDHIVNKPPHDNRIIRYNVLKNKLKCISVSDSKINKSYIVACVNVGSLGNKKYYNGIAHLLEHMCFITSKKYKTKGYIHNKALEFGGYTNAYTDDIHTVYYYEIFTKHLEEMIEIFADYLFNSELKEEYILNELKNVDSEHKKNLNNDIYRIFNIEHMLADEKSEYNGFFTGSLETLNKKDIREKMLDFYKKYYVPNNISLCIISDIEINKIDKMIKTHFEDFTNTKNSKKLIITKPIYTKNLNKAFLVNSINNTFQIKYIFETYDLNKYKKTKIFDFVSFLLNLETKNSLSDYLKINNYIKSLVSYFETNTGLFIIHLELTKKGYHNINDIDGYLKYYINFIFTIDYKQLYNILNNIYNYNYNNLSKEDPINFGQMLVINAFLYESKNIYDGSYLLLDYNKKHFKDIPKYLDFNNCIQIIITNVLKEKTYLVDPYYGTKYTEIKKINSPPKEFFINIHYENKYINNQLTIIPKLKQYIPIETSKNIWFGNTSNFDEKNCYIGIIFSDRKFFSSVKNTIYTNISIDLLDYLLSRELYYAISVNYTFDFFIDTKYNEILLRINVFNNINQSQEFINYIINFIINKNIKDLTEDFIKQKINNLIDNIKNIDKMSPWNYVDYLFNLNYKNKYDTNTILNELEQFNINKFLVYFNNLFKKSNCVIITYGNINKQFNFELLKNNLTNKYEFSNFNINNSIKIKHPNKNEKNNCIKLILKLGKLDDILFLHLTLTIMMIHEIFYNKLRTEKLLGYLVLSTWTQIYDEYYIIEKIQSIYDYTTLYESLNEFNKNLIEYLDKVNIQDWIQTLKDHLQIKDTNINDVFLKYYSEISKREFRFNKNKELLFKTKYITEKSVKQFIKKYIVNNNDIFTIFVEKN